MPAVAQTAAPLLYRIEPADLHGHRYTVTIKVQRPQALQQVSLPVWIPGSYLVREFARHLSPITATQGRQPVAVRSLDKATWEVACHSRSALTLRYEVYAFDTSVRAAFLDTRRGFFNGTSVFLCVAGLEAQPHRVQITGGPRGWRVATALRPLQTDADGWGDYEAPDYDALVDHPVELGDFWQGDFTVRGVRHVFAVAGAPDDFDARRLLDDTRRICEAQIGFWHGRRKADFQQYVFLLNAVDDGYGGLEHRQSTALICSRKDLPRLGRPVNKDAYTTLLGLISHEYFHTWNVKRLKPAEFAPYDYTRENHTRMLWFFEGFTSYYDDQFLLRTGLVEAPAYLKLLARTINLVLATPGRAHYSAGQASFDAWTRYYRPDENTANATVNYYTKGALVALCLDLALRSLPPVEGRQPSLDGVMSRLWHLRRPITSPDVADALQAEAEQAPPAWAQPDAGARADGWAGVLHAWTEGTCELPLRAALGAMGVTWRTLPAPVAQRLGVRVSEAQGQLKVQAVMRGSIAEQAGLSAGDEWLALDAWRVRRPDDLNQWHDATREQAVLVARDGHVLPLTLPALGEHGGAVLVGLEGAAVAQLSSSTAARRLAWLKV